MILKLGRNRECLPPHLAGIPIIEIHPFPLATDRYSCYPTSINKDQSVSREVGDNSKTLLDKKKATSKKKEKEKSIPFQDTSRLCNERVLLQASLWPPSGSNLSDLHLLWETVFWRYFPRSPFAHAVTYSWFVNWFSIGEVFCVWQAHLRCLIYIHFEKRSIRGSVPEASLHTL